ncbi:MAG TPA: 2-dehydropantoate 2-reductase [Oscillospiraceae bacterium]|nr:2-dehydropantoate 2-reductase [Oscillospiraceae bacterium]
MNYLVIGAGGVGGCLVARLGDAGLTVDVLARGENDEAMKRHGLLFHGLDRDYALPAERCFTEAEYAGKPDFILLCTKTYSVEPLLPFLKRIAHPGAVLLPLMNGLFNGARLAELLPEYEVIDGCIYLGGYLSAPGEVTQTGKVIRPVFGEFGKEHLQPALSQFAADLRQAGIEHVYSHEIRKEILLKFVWISCYAAACIHFDCDSTPLIEEPEKHTFFESLAAEEFALAGPLGVALQDGAKENLLSFFWSATKPGTWPSAYMDYKKGGRVETDTLIAEPLRIGEAAGLPMPCLRAVADGIGLSV